MNYRLANESDIETIRKLVKQVEEFGIMPFKEGESDKNSVWAKFAYTASDGKNNPVIVQHEIVFFAK